MGRIAWLICAVLVCAAANAQVEPSFRNLGVADGLPSSQVLDVMQDRSGYLWMATQDGLARFDGVGFKVFRNEPSDAESIPCNDVQTVFEDSRERLWVGCSDRGFGLLRDRDAGRFVPFQEEQKRLGFDSLDVFTFTESPSGNLWMGTFRRGVLRLDANGHLHRLDEWMPLDAPLHQSDVLELHVDRLGDLWLATTAGLWRIKQIDDREHARAEKVLSDGMALTLFEAADGQLWIGSARAVHRIAVGGAADTIMAVPGLDQPILVEGIAQDAAGITWLGTASGLMRLAPGRAAQVLAPRAAVPDSLPSPQVQDLLVDHEGGLWIATRDKGLAYLRPDRDNFELIQHDALDERSLPPGRLAGIEQCPDGRLYSVSALGGLAEIDAAGVVNRIGKSPLSRSEGLSTHSLMCDPDGYLWLGRPAAVTRLDPRNGEVRTWGVADGLVPGYIQLLAAGGGAVWMVSLGSGVSRIDAQGKISTWQTAERGIVIADFEQIAVGSDGRVWLADAAGIRTLDGQSDVFQATQGGPQTRVTSFYLDADGTLWTASAAGVEQWQIDGRALRRLLLIGAEQGLPAVAFSAMLIDPSRQMWLTSSRGLWRVTLAPITVELMDSRRGLRNLQYIDAPTLHLLGGKVVAATREGLLRFEPMKLAKVKTAPPLQLASASIRRYEIRVDLDPLANSWDLRWDDRDLRVEARALSFADVAANHYGFLLDGHDASWVDTQARPEREFTRIQSGTYRLRIHARNVSGVAASNEILRTLHVGTPPWLIWQAWLAYIVALGAIIWVAIASWRRRIERRHRLLMAEERRLAAEKASSAKSDFLADIGHEIRTPMAGVLGMTDLLARSPLDSNQHRWTVSIKRSGEHMLRLINDLLDLSRIEAGMLELSPQATEIRGLVEEIRTLEAPLAEARGIVFSAEVDAQFPRWIHCDGRRLKQILLNLVNNALKFTERGTVAISIAQPESKWMLMQVSDSGPGMSADQLAQLFARFRQTESGKQKGGSGLGLAITAQLVRLLGGAIDVDSAPGRGTRFIVRLPIEECAAPAPPVVDTTSNAVPLAGIGVLLVDDDAAIREVNARLLEDLGALVEVAPHALEALSRFQPDTQRMVMLDLDLPGIDGIQLVALLKSRAAATGLLAVAVTARSDADTEQRCRDAGFDDFMRKPVSTEQLLDAARHWRTQLRAAIHLPEAGNG